MSMDLKDIIVVLGMLILVSACTPDESVEGMYQVPPSVQPYVDRFVEEAGERGVTLSLTGLHVSFASKRNARHFSAAGMCHYVEWGHPQIALDTNSVNWKNGEASREILIFHELAHCLLGRTHKNDRLPNGNYASIMRSEGDPVYGVSFNDFKREYYLDELFDEDTPHPAWAKKIPRYESFSSQQKQLIFRETFEDNRHKWPLGRSSFTIRELSQGALRFEAKDEGAYLMTQFIPFDTQRDFELEARMRVVSGDHPVMLHWGGNLFLGFTADQYAFTGEQNLGTSSGKTFMPLSSRNYNLLTIRKQQDTYYLYLNRQFFDMGTYEPLQDQYLGFYVGNTTQLMVDELTVSYLVE